jgi:hypothetical protein
LKWLDSLELMMKEVLKNMNLKSENSKGVNYG